MVAKDHSLAIAESVRDAFALLGVHDDAGVFVEKGVVVVEGTHILGDRLEQPAQSRPGFAVYRMSVCGCDNVGTSGVHLRMDGERGDVEVTASLDNVAGVIHED